MEEELNQFAAKNKFQGKGPLSVAIVVTEYAKGLVAAESKAAKEAAAVKDAGEEYLGSASKVAGKGRAKVAAKAAASGPAFPIDSNSLLAKSGTQVKGLNSKAVQLVLARHGVEQVLSSEAGRTSRGSVANMQEYVAFLNQQHALDQLDLEVAESFWATQVKNFLADKPFVMKLDASWGVRASVRHLTEQAIERQKGAGGSMFLGTMMQHLVGAKLEVLLGAGKVEHHSANQSDQKAGRHGDFDIGDVAIHVTSAPSEALIKKCQANLGKGKRPMIITSRRGLLTAEGLLSNIEMTNRVDVIEFEQFIATNVFEIGKFSGPGRTTAFTQIAEAYNAIIEKFETPSLKIELTAGR